MGKRKRTSDGSLNRAIGFGLVQVEETASKLRERLLKRMMSEAAPVDFINLLTIAREELSDFAPIYAQMLLDSQLASWIRGLEIITNQTPQWLLDVIEEQALVPDIDSDDVTFTNILQGVFEDDSEQFIEFPEMSSRVASLVNKKVVGKEEFERVSQEIAQRSFTVANVNTVDKLEQIQKELTLTIAEGKTQKEFENKLEDIVGTGILSPSHAENVFRTNMQKAFAEGKEHVMSNPLVNSQFPYARYDAINDGRVRDEHEDLEKLGIQGTNIYQSDDPMWIFFTPPWDFGCRCNKTFMTIRQAARKGIREAQKWIDTGIPPEPNHRLGSIPFGPNPAFVPVRTSL